MARLVLVPRGNLGNQMLQLMFATVLARRVPGLAVEGHDLPLWGLGRPVRRRAGLLVPSIRLQDPDLEPLVRHFRSGLLREARFRGVPLTLALLGEPDWHRSAFSRPAAAAFEAGEEDLLISVRGDEILGPRHPDYGPIPVELYAGLARRTGLRPVFLGQIGDDPYSRLLRERFPRARFVPSQGILGDWESLRRARHLVLSVSTFSWLAGWLSRAATIHLPMLGLLNPAQRPDAWLLPEADPRYRFLEAPLRRWTASPEQVAALAAPVAWREVTRDELAERRRRAEEARRPLRERATRSLRLRAALAWPFLRG